MEKICPLKWKKDMPAFREKTMAFYSGELSKNEYKGFSGLYGSYAQKDGKASMLRLRMTAGCVTKEKLAFLAKAIEKYPVPRAHFTTGQTVQFHDLDGETVCAMMEEALEAGIVTMGGGGDFPRNVMCSPLAGVCAQEYFNVQPWAQAAADYLMHFIKAEKMPRKLKVGFSGSEKNVTHATFRDLGFAARPDGRFDVYTAGGLGNNPRFGVRVAEAVEKEEILYYIKAMWLTFRAYGNYENRGKARTRYMVEALGGVENYVKAYQEKLAEVRASGEDLTLRDVKEEPICKAGDGSTVEDPRAFAQKQPGLYAVCWHPIGGVPDVKQLGRVCAAAAAIEGAQMRLSPEQCAYIVNLTGEEAKQMLALTQGGACTQFETSVSCIGGATCQVGLRDSQALLHACVDAVRAAELPDGALPQMHISGCPSSCGTHQIGAFGFRGASKNVNGEAKAAYVFYVGGCDAQGREAMGEEIGTMLEEDIPAFLVALGKTVAQSGMHFAAWQEKHPQGVREMAEKYLVK